MSYSGPTIILPLPIQPGTTAPAVVPNGANKVLAINDIDLGSPTSGQVLAWNGTAWVPTNPSSGGGGGAAPSMASVAITATKTSATTATIDFTPPTPGEGEAITGYRVCHEVDGVNTGTVDIITTSVPFSVDMPVLTAQVVDGISTNSHKYVFCVQALNGATAGVGSPDSNAVINGSPLTVHATIGWPTWGIAPVAHNPNAFSTHTGPDVTAAIQTQIAQARATAWDGSALAIYDMDGAFLVTGIIWDDRVNYTGSSAAHGLALKDASNVPIVRNRHPIPLEYNGGTPLDDMMGVSGEFTLDCNGLGQTGVGQELTPATTYHGEALHYTTGNSILTGVFLCGVRGLHWDGNIHIRNARGFADWFMNCPSAYVHGISAEWSGTMLNSDAFHANDCPNLNVDRISSSGSVDDIGGINWCTGFTFGAWALGNGGKGIRLIGVCSGNLGNMTGDANNEHVLIIEPDATVDSLSFATSVNGAVGMQLGHGGNFSGGTISLQWVKQDVLTFGGPLIEVSGTIQDLTLNACAADDAGSGTGVLLDVSGEVVTLHAVNNNLSDGYANLYTGNVDNYDDQGGNSVN